MYKQGEKALTTKALASAMGFFLLPSALDAAREQLLSSWLQKLESMTSSLVIICCTIPFPAF
jgi:hypothetical protein